MFRVQGPTVQDYSLGVISYSASCFLAIGLSVAWATFDLLVYKNHKAACGTTLHAEDVVEFIAKGIELRL